MDNNVFPVDELVEVDLSGYLEADASTLEEVFDLDGKELT